MIVLGALGVSCGVWCGGGDLQNEDPNTCVQFRGQSFSEAAFFLVQYRR